MKRFFSIGLLAAFTIATVGVVVNSYSCKMMEMKTAKCCNTASKGCCEREVKLLKLNDDFVSSSYHAIPKFICDNVTLFSSCDVVSKIASLSPFSALKDHAPPGPPVDRLSFIQSFLI